MAYWDSAVAELSEESWKQELEAHAIAVVHFWVAWSPPDLAMSKVIAQVRPEFASIAFFYVDIAGDGAGMAKMFDAYQTPVLICFLSGQQHGVLAGYVQADQLRAKLRDWLAAST